ncbi:MAG TPA: hypothetical protein VMN60_14675 [Longimicrobiales bacterium]|nr:hypothetical protein [Longimicrobiales bacterium]
MAKTRGGSYLPVIVAFVAIGAFLGWLAMQQKDDAVAVTEPGDTANAQSTQPATSATVVDPADMAVSATVRGLVGQTIELQSVPVSSPMGAQLFWIELPGGSPYLVKLDSAAVAAGRTFPTTGNVRIVGRVLEKNNALLDQWMQNGVLTSADQKMQAEFGSTYLEASQVAPAGG